MTPTDHAFEIYMVLLSSSSRRTTARSINVSVDSGRRSRPRLNKVDSFSPKTSSRTFLTFLKIRMITNSLLKLLESLELYLDNLKL